MHEPSKLVENLQHLHAYYHREKRNLKSPSKLKSLGFSTYAVPDNNVSAHATKVNKLSTAYSGGKKVLLKGNVVVSDNSEEQAVHNFVTFLEQIKKASSGSTMVLIAHNGDGFDFPVLVN